MKLNPTARYALSLLTLSAALSMTVSAQATAPAAPAPTTSSASKPLIQIFRVDTVTVQGKETEKLVPVTTVKPGDLLERTVTVTVTKKASGAAMTLPVPEQMNHLAGSASVLMNGKPVDMKLQGMKVLYSLEETGPFSAAPTKVVKVKENGKDVSKTVPAPASEYRAVRFSLGDVLPGTYLMRHRVSVR